MAPTYAAALCLLATAPFLASQDEGGELTVEKLEEVRDEVLADVEDLRGGSFERPVDVQVTTKEGFIEYVKKRTEEMQPAEQRSAEQQVAKLLGLIPVDMDLEATMFEFLESQVGGFYEPSEETFYVVETFSEPGILRVILVHELTHALDDQMFGIDTTLAPLLKTNSDAAVAFHAVVEGSGTTVMNQWVVPRIMKGEISAAEIAKAGSTAGFEGMPEYIWLPLMHSYLQGAAFLARTDSVMAGAMAKPPAGDIDRAFKSPPRSTEQVLHPEKYWDEDSLDEPHLIKLDTAALAEGWSLLKEDTLGEVNLGLFTRAPSERQEFSALPDFTNDAAAGWGGDRYALLGKDDARILHLVTSWDSETDTDEFIATLKGISEHVTAGAQKLGEGEGAFEWVRSEDADEVRITVRMGVSAEDAKRVVATVKSDVIRE